MKILMIDKYYYRKGGSQTYLLELKQKLEDEGHEIIMFSMKSEENIPSQYESYFVDHVDYSSGGLNKIKNSLSKLINEGFVSRDGDKFYFLSKNERDINYKIIRSNVNSHDINNLLCREIFDEVIGIVKFKYQGKGYFGINQFFDNGEYRVSKANLIGIKVLMTNYDENFNLDLIRVISSIENNVIVYLDNDKSLVEEINLYLKLDKFLKYNKDSYKDSFYEIIKQKEVEHNNRLERVKVLILDNIKSAKIFVNGEILCKKFSSVGEIFRIALNDIISCRFNKFFYIERVLDSTKDMLVALNDDKMLNEILICNSLFMKELFNFLSNVGKIKISDIISHFKQIPYGFNRHDVLFGILCFVKEGKLFCDYSFDKLKEFVEVKGSLNKIYVEFLDNGGKHKFNIYKKLFEEIFGKKYFVNSIDELKVTSSDDFNEILERINLIKNISKSNNVYLNIDFVNEFENFIFEFKDANLCDLDENLILSKFEKFELVHNFYTSVQFEIFKRAIVSIEIFNKDKNFIPNKNGVYECALKIKEVLHSDDPYRSISKLKGYVNSFFEIHSLYLDQNIKYVDEFLDKEIADFICEDLLYELKDKLNGCSSLFDIYGVKMEGIFLKDRGIIDE